MIAILIFRIILIFICRNMYYSSEDKGIQSFLKTVINILKLIAVQLLLSVMMEILIINDHRILTSWYVILALVFIWLLRVKWWKNSRLWTCSWLVVSAGGILLGHVFVLDKYISTAFISPLLSPRGYSESNYLVGFAIYHVFINIFLRISDRGE